MSGTLIVTGASSDVGIALIKRVAKNYDRIICHYYSSAALIEDLRQQSGNKIVPVQADFSDEAQTQLFVRKAIPEIQGNLHFLHLSSSSSSVNVKFHRTDWACFEREINITLRSAVVCCQAFAPLMAKAKSGKIVIMLSGQTIWEPAKPYSAAYTCVKYALLGLVKSLSAEYMSRNITVNGVSPSMIDTKFLHIPDVVKQLNMESSPLKRLLTVEDVIPTFEFLLSPGADTITGQNIAVTAGC